jgi:hypothetical protein
MVGACFLVVIDFWRYAQWPIKKSFDESVFL